MIDNRLIQKAIIAKLKANTTLINWLTTFSAQDEIRESEWQGTNFVYPAIRVQVGTQIEIGNPPCYSQTPFTVYCLSEENSSQQADYLAYLVNSALIRKNLQSPDFTTSIVVSDGAIKAIRLSERLWQSVNNYTVNIYGGFISG